MWRVACGVGEGYSFVKRVLYVYLTDVVCSMWQSACRAAFLSAPVRLVEALFKCDLQCDRVRVFILVYTQIHV